jgi:tetratricopeptide (TPR) repeat protein
MAKQQRQTRPAPARGQAKGRQKAMAAVAKPATATLAGSKVLSPVREAAPPQQPERKPGYHQAIALYEGAVRLLQRHEFVGAAEQFRAVITGYPDERELLERARLYLRVCERETTRQPKPSPRTPEERIYAATMSLNAGDIAGALTHLRQALDENPNSDHGHYIMAVALSDSGEADKAIIHLQRAIQLNPDNRALARQDPDLEGLRSVGGFSAALETSVARRVVSQDRERRVRRR